MALDRTKYKDHIEWFKDYLSEGQTICFLLCKEGAVSFYVGATSETLRVGVVFLRNTPEKWGYPWTSVNFEDRQNEDAWTRKPFVLCRETVQLINETGSVLSEFFGTDKLNPSLR